ncbi:hypothetical protein TIFTF001_009156 [Ficus carica]|uniref:Uncharacterized protein n=1 Tax=Ficus carica TaxID=3494 RepID=A0AA88D3D8_FICCA|nr:hypothetical protein TIFTF001_009156 [Ficus carica]
MTTSPREARRQISRSYDQNSYSRSVNGYDGVTPSRGRQLHDTALIGDGAPSTKIGKEEERTHREGATANSIDEGGRQWQQEALAAGGSKA